MHLLHQDDQDQENIFKLDVEVLCDLSSQGGIYNHHQRVQVVLAVDRENSSPSPRLTRPGHHQIWAGHQFYCPLFSFTGPVSLIVCEYLHMLTVYRCRL